MTEIPTLKLNSGTEIPQLGFGVFLVPPPETVQAVTDALDAGYRHIDTAEMYENEQEVGEAIRQSGIDREDLFVTSKLNNRFQTYDDALKAFDATLDALGFDYLDLFLIHWPLPTIRDFMDVWPALERVQREGRARAIGVSNFQVHHLERLLGESEIAPAVNQIECHPYLTQDVLRHFGESRDIVTEAWSPIGRGKVLDDPAITEVADRLDRTPAQVVLRWHIQRGSVIFPKSTHPERIRENIELFDFELSSDDMDALSGLNRGERVGPDPDTFDMVP